MKKNNFVLMLIITVVVILGIAGYIVYKKAIITEQNDILSKIYLELSKYRDLNNNLVNLLRDNNGNLYWTSNDDYLIKVSSSPQVELNYNCANNPESFDKSFEKTAPELITKIKNIFTQNSFKEYRKSTTDLLDGFVNYSYIDSKNTLFCNLSVYTVCGGLIVTCNNESTYQKAYNEQINKLRDMRIKSSVLDLVSSYGNFYLFSRHPEFGGSSTIIAQKTDYKWVKLSEGQDFISCDVANKYKIPHQLGDIAVRCVNFYGKLVDNPN